MKRNRIRMGVVLAAALVGALGSAAPAAADEALERLRGRFDVGDYRAVVAGAASAIEAGGRLACDTAELHALSALAHARLGEREAADAAWCLAIERCPVWEVDLRYTVEERGVVDALRESCVPEAFTQSVGRPSLLPETLRGRWQLGLSLGFLLPSGDLDDSRHYAANDGETNAMPVDAGPFGGVSRGLPIGITTDYFFHDRWAFGGEVMLHLLGQDPESWFEEEFIQVSHRIWQIGAHAKLMLRRGGFAPYLKGGLGILIERYTIEAIDFPTIDDPYRIERTRTNPALQFGAGLLALATPVVGIEAEAGYNLGIDSETIGGPPDGLYLLDDQTSELTLDEVTRSTGFFVFRIQITATVGSL